jgi:hypothetical protein
MGLSREARFSVPESIRTRTVEDRLIILNLKGGKYFTLNESGRRIWELVAEAKSFGEIVEAMQAEYDADASTVASDVEQILAELISEGVALVNESGGN